MPERINGGQALVALGAIALIVSLFLHWYEPGRSAWAVFEVWDLVLAAIGVAALGAAIPMRRGAADPFLVPQRWLPALGGASLVIVIVALVNHPPAARGAGLEAGAWIALGAVVVLAAGAVLTRARISLVITLRPSETVRNRPSAPEPSESPPEVFEAETRTEPIPRQGRP